MFLRVSKYPPNVIFRNVNINVQRANITGSMKWHNNVEPPMYVRTYVCRTCVRSPNVVAFSSVHVFTMCMSVPYPF